MRRKKKEEKPKTKKKKAEHKKKEEKKESNISDINTLKNTKKIKEDYTYESINPIKNLKKKENKTNILDDLLNDSNDEEEGKYNIFLNKIIIKIKSNLK